MLDIFNIITIEAITEQKIRFSFIILIEAKENILHISKAENDRVSIEPVADKLKKFGVVSKNRHINRMELFRLESFIVFMFYFNISNMWLNQAHGQINRRTIFG